ncbi:DedA family protein [Candidatus Saccharibacteria bacterium]|nr:DedA family protein [Candidatus Saccharibacteria bacterium]
MFDVEAILQSGGLIILALIIFAECGLLIGFFLPGDTLLVAAGLLASTNPETFPILLVLPIAFLAATVGYQVGYLIGERAGPRIFKRSDGILFREDYVDRAEAFFKRHGPIAIIFARFVPIVRTIVPLVAGVGKMPKGYFTFYNIVGGFLWTIGLTLAAYWIGSRIPNLDKIIVPLVILATVATTSSVLLQLLRSKEKRRQLKSAISQEWEHFFRSKK